MVAEAEPTVTPPGLTGPAVPPARAVPTGPTGIDAASIDPFAVWIEFAKSVRGGNVWTSTRSFVEAWKPPIDVKVDKRQDLAAFGKGPHQFLKTPRQKKPEEMSSDTTDRMKHDLERQFNLRNLARFVKTVNRDDPLEFKRKAVEIGKLDFDARARIKDVFKPVDGITLELGGAAVRGEIAWRHKILEVIQWEEWFSREAREHVQGPLWQNNPEKPKPPANAGVLVAKASATAAVATSPSETEPPAPETTKGAGGE